MNRITLTDSARVQFVQLSGSDSCMASLIVAAVVIQKKRDCYRSEQAHMVEQRIGNMLEGLRRIEISRSKNSSSATWDGDSVEIEDVYAYDDGMGMFRDMTGAIKLRDEFAKLFGIYEFEPVIELSIEGIPGASYGQLSVLMRGLTTVTGIEINITGVAA